MRGKQKVSKSRARVEDYQIVKSWEVAYQQLRDFALWRDQPELYKAIEGFYKKTGRRKVGARCVTYKQLVKCPQCEVDFEVELFLDKKTKEVLAQSSNYGIKKNAERERIES